MLLELKGLKKEVWKGEGRVLVKTIVRGGASLEYWGVLRRLWVQHFTLTIRLLRTSGPATEDNVTCWNTYNVISRSSYVIKHHSY